MNTQPTTGSVVSPDGAWRWTGSQWVPNRQQPQIAAPVVPPTPVPSQQQDRGDILKPGSFLSVFLVTWPPFGVGMAVLNAVLSGDFAANILSSFLPGMFAGVLFGILMGLVLRQQTRVIPGATVDSVGSKLLSRGYSQSAQTAGLTVYRANSGLSMIKDQTQVYLVPRNGGVEVKAPRHVAGRLG